MRHPRSQKSKRTIEVSSPSAIAHVLNHCPQKIQRVTFFSHVNQLNPRLAELYQLAKQHGVKIDFAGRDRTQEPVSAYLQPFEYTEFNELIERTKEKKRAMVLALDHLQDPQNFGALCRTAEALNFSGILIPKDRGVTVGPGVYNASVGAVETIPICLVTNIGECLRQLKEAEFWIVGTALEEGGKSPWEMPDFEKVALVLGSELEGVSHGLKKICDWQTEIPLDGEVQSLNVSVAGALVMYELWRRTKIETS